MLKPGTLLSDRYTIDSVLGQGGMGAVYLARMEALGDKKVAVKEMVLQGFSNDELTKAVEQFKREAAFLANLEHPNLVQVTDFFVEGEKHYLVMAYITGETLQQKLKRQGRPFTWAQIKPYAEPLVEVLHYLHTQDPPILFRDLKPANIMIEESGRLRLIDFGIARTAQAGDRTSTFLQGTGTSGFSPIEQYGSTQSTDQRSDIYSLGATLYYLMTGKLPPDAVARISQGKELIPASKINPSLPPGMDELLSKAMEVRQQGRHNSMMEFKQEMMALAASGIDDDGVTEDFGQLPAVGESTRTPPPSVAPQKEKPATAIKIEMFPTAPQQPKQSNTPWIIGASSLAVASFAIIAMISSYMPGDPDPNKSPVSDQKITQNVEASSQAKPKTIKTRPVAEVEKSESKTKERPKTASVKVRPDYIKPLEKPLSESVKRKPQSRPKPVQTRVASQAPSRPSLGGGSYPTSNKSYPTAKPKQPVAQPVVTQPVVRQPITSPPPQQQQPVARRGSRTEFAPGYQGPRTGPNGEKLVLNDQGYPLPPEQQPWYKPGMGHPRGGGPGGRGPRGGPGPGPQGGSGSTNNGPPGYY